jgi:phosphopentomutase
MDNMSGPFDRIVLVVLDSVGIGAMPDAADYGDSDRDTLGHICEARTLHVPNLVRLGLANIRPLAGLKPAVRPQGSYGKAALLSPGKDTTAGHWEMAGIILKQPFPTYPNGFPAEIVEPYERAIGRKVLGNCAASGTEIIKQLGEEHMRTGRPIVYTSADSVFQVAAHEDVIPLAQLYAFCETARALLHGKHRVGRVIARPFIGQPGAFKRTDNRHDYAVPPPKPMLLDLLEEAGLDVIGVGKIPDIFEHRGISRVLAGHHNREALLNTEAALGEGSAEKSWRGLLFTNLVDFDMLYGHRLDVEGYARALEEIDILLKGLLSALRERDLLILTADHGCDPLGPSTDHSREYVPLIAAGPSVKRAVKLGTRATLADVGQTIAENFGLTISAGVSFLSQVADQGGFPEG